MYAYAPALHGGLELDPMEWELLMIVQGTEAGSSAIVATALNH